MIEGVLSQIAKQFAQRLRAMEDVAADQLFYLRERLFAFDQGSNPSYIGLTGV